MLARRTSTAALTAIGLKGALRLALALAVVGLGAPAQAQPLGRGIAPEVGGQTATLVERQSLVAERQRVHADLERANAEIDALKRSGRGLREDYRLRERLADAEALARRLTALDARLGGAPSAAPWPAPGAEPRALPTDGPAELEAKADILNDQARRLAARGDALLGRAHDLRARQNLRRRVGQMERDPFAPLEGSKRRAMASAPAHAPSGGSTVTADQAAPPPQSAPGGPSVTTSVPPSGTKEGAGFSGAPTDSSAGSSAVSAPRAIPTPTGPSSEGVALSTQLRNLLDPTTLAELQRLEATGSGATGYEALERAAAALKARAERLSQQAAALRARAH